MWAKSGLILSIHKLRKYQQNQNFGIKKGKKKKKKKKHYIWMNTEYFSNTDVVILDRTGLN